jgi:hypothetical protein
MFPGIIQQALELLGVDLDHRQFPGDLTAGTPGLSIHGSVKTRPAHFRIGMHGLNEGARTDIEWTSGLPEVAPAAAPDKVFRQQTEAGLYRVVVDVGDASECEQHRRLSKGLIGPIEGVPAQSISMVVVAGVFCIQAAHAGGQLRRAPPQHEMVMVAHEDEGPKGAPRFLESVGQKDEELSAILVVADQFKSSSSPGENMPLCSVAIESPHREAAASAALHPGSGRNGDFLDRKNGPFQKIQRSSVTKETVCFVTVSQMWDSLALRGWKTNGLNLGLDLLP